MKKTMKKIVSGGLSLLALSSLFLSACGNGGSGKQSGKTTLTVWAWDVALKQLEEAGKVYQESHPDVELKFEEMGTDQIYKKLSTSLATGNGIADIICIEGEYLVGYADKFPEGFLDLSDIVDEKDFLPSKISEVKYNDKIQAFPWDAGPEALFYRTDYFEEAGVDAASLKTWEDLIEAGKKIEATCKTPSGDPVKMLPVDPRKTNFYTLMRSQLGKGAFDENGNPIVNSAESIQAMKEAAKVYESGVCLNYNGWDEYEQTVVNESVACIPEAVWMIGTIKDKGPDTKGKWSVVDLPMISGGQYSCNNGGSDIVINAKTKSPDAAKDFLKFAMTDMKLQASGFENFGLYPSYIPSYEEEVFSKGDPFFGSTNVYTVFIENGKKVADIATSPNSLEANDSISAAVSKIFLNKEDVEKTMNDLQAELEGKFAKK